LPALLEKDLLNDLGRIRTDLAMEAREMVTQQQGLEEIPGIKTQSEQKGTVQLTRVMVETPEAGQTIGKQPGYYVTLESPALRQRDRDELEKVAFTLAEEIEGFIRHFNVGEDTPCLVVGLGNWNATPDALGPRVVDKILVTRHLFASTPPEKKGGLRPVCAISPGVLGITGMETVEIVDALVKKIHPQFLVVIDALASRSTSRLGTTIQLADTGIHPGSGIGNKRMGITPEALGLPVLAIGVPTVVEAVTIIHDALDQMGRTPGSMVSPTISQKRDLVQRILQPYLRSLIVTPKEVDVLIEEIAKVVSGALNIALHPGVSPEEVFRYLQ
jgi:spore protease